MSLKVLHPPHITFTYNMYTYIPYMVDSLHIRINLANLTVCFWGKKGNGSKVQTISPSFPHSEHTPLRSVRW